MPHKVGNSMMVKGLVAGQVPGQDQEQDLIQGSLKEEWALVWEEWHKA